MEIKVFHNQEPATIPFEKQIKLMGYGMNYFIIVTTNNELYCFNKENMKLCEKKNPSTTPITYLICNLHHIYIINNLNDIYVKEIYDDDTINYNFKRMENNNFKDKIKFVRNGSNYFLIVTKTNAVYGYGENRSGQLGLQKTEEHFIKEITKIDIEKIQLKDLQCGNSHSILLDIFGSIYVTGENNDGPLGTGDTDARFKFTIYADNCTSFIVNEFNELYGCGYNREGQLGINPAFNIKTFTKIVMDDFKINNYHFWYSNNECSFITDEKNIIYISGGIYSSSVVHKYFSITPEVIGDNNYENSLAKFIVLNCPKIDKSRRYVHLCPLEEMTVIVTSNYKFNVEEEDNLIGFKYLQKAKGNQLVDVSILCCDD